MARRSAVEPARGAIDVVFILLALQCGIGFLSATGGLIFGLISGSPLLLLWTLLFGFGVPATLACSAFAIERGSRRARRLLLAFEALLLAESVLRGLFGMLPASAPLALATGAALPLLIGGLLLTPGVRQLFRRQSAVQQPASGAMWLPVAAKRRQASCEEA
jgi:hypothetical protein